MSRTAASAMAFLPFGSSGGRAMAMSAHRHDEGQSANGRRGRILPTILHVQRELVHLFSLIAAWIGALEIDDGDEWRLLQVAHESRQRLNVDGAAGETERDFLARNRGRERLRLGVLWIDWRRRRKRDHVIAADRRTGVL